MMESVAFGDSDFPEEVDYVFIERDFSSDDEEEDEVMYDHCEDFELYDFAVKNEVEGADQVGGVFTSQMPFEEVASALSIVSEDEDDEDRGKVDDEITIQTDLHTTEVIPFDHESHRLQVNENADVSPPLAPNVRNVDVRQERSTGSLQNSDLRVSMDTSSPGRRLSNKKKRREEKRARRDATAADAAGYRNKERKDRSRHSSLPKSLNRSRRRI